MSMKSLILAVSLVVIIAYPISVLLLGQGVTKVNIDRIETGMSFEAVQEVFGGEEPSDAMGRAHSFGAIWRSKTGATAEIMFGRKMTDNGLSEWQVASKEWTWFETAR
jgi:hypothetical protein